MLATPQHGWTQVTIKDSTIDGVSYTCYPHTVLCEAFVHYLSSDIYEVGTAQFDKEGDYALVVLSMCGITVVDDGKSVTYDLPEEEMVTLAEELARDIEKDFDLWVEWDCPDDDDQERRECERILLDYLSALKESIAAAKC